MRHIGSLFAGLIIAPIAWLLIGAATLGFSSLGDKAPDGTPSTVIASAMFAGAGILLGLLAVTRFSPAGPLTVTVIFGVGILLYRIMEKDWAVPGLVAAKIPGSAANTAADTGSVVIIAALMVVAALIPSRWRGKNTDEDRDLDTATLAGSSSGFNTPASTTGAINPFDTSSTQPTGSSGFGEQPTNPFDSPQQQFGAQTAPQAPEQRSPYADDSYGQQDGFDNYGGGQQQQQPQQQEAPRYGSGQQYR